MLRPATKTVRADSSSAGPAAAACAAGAAGTRAVDADTAAAAAAVAGSAAAVSTAMLFNSRQKTWSRKPTQMIAHIAVLVC